MCRHILNAKVSWWNVFLSDDTILRFTRYLCKQGAVTIGMIVLSVTMKSTIIVSK